MIELIKIPIDQNIHDGSWSCAYAFNNKIVKLFDDSIDGLVNKIEDEFKKIFDHAFEYEISFRRDFST